VKYQKYLRISEPQPIFDLVNIRATWAKKANFFCPFVSYFTHCPFERKKTTNLHLHSIERSMPSQRTFKKNENERSSLFPFDEVSVDKLNAIV